MTNLLDPNVDSRLDSTRIILTGHYALLLYEELPPISRTAFADVLAVGTIQAQSEALLRLALHDADFSFVEQNCHRALDQQDANFRRAGVLALGHLARLHQRVSDATVARLRSLRSDPQLAGAAADALDDIAVFTHP